MDVVRHRAGAGLRRAKAAARRIWSPWSGLGRVRPLLIVAVATLLQYVFAAPAPAYVSKHLYVAIEQIGFPDMLQPASILRYPISGWTIASQT